MTGKQLKNAILQLAIQGKLVPQDPTDEPASALLARIRKEKEQLLKVGKLKKKDLETTPISDEEKPFELPDGWEWCRMDDLAAYRKGPFGSSLTKSMFVPKGADSVKVYEQKNAIQKDWRLGDYYISKEKYLGMQG
ncbi:MAG: restriction endonuclease subunit S, partial [Bacteroidales bacterium]|nr:restriction endonuclease subunit S [Candidatus Colimorpha pelethequi]